MSNLVGMALARGVDTGRGRPSGAHHVGWQVADQERNRQFFEDIIGLPLIATFADESTVNPGLTFSHALYELAADTVLAKDVFERCRVNPYDDLCKWMSGDHAITRLTATRSRIPSRKNTILLHKKPTSVIWRG